MAGVRFFYMSYADINRDAVTLALSNNSAEQESLINRDPFFQWESIGSNDSNSVTAEINFGTPRTIDSLILTLNNLKSFSFEYLNGSSVWTQILTQANNTQETFFQQFSPVTCQQVRLIMNSTRTPDAQKTLRDLIVTKQIGQLVGYPGLGFENNDRETVKTMLNGKERKVYSGPDRAWRLNFKDYPNTADRGLLLTLKNLRESFLIWPCGGDESQFRYADEGYRLEDIYLVNVSRGFNHSFTQNLYFSGMNAQLVLNEAA